MVMRVRAGRRGMAANNRRRHRRGCGRGHHDEARRCCPGGDVELSITPLVELWALGDRSGGTRARRDDGRSARRRGRALLAEGVNAAANRLSVIN